MKQCIYCLQVKADNQFNREHVCQQSFGVFENNLVLDCVCRACNKFFGDGIDQKLACDSAEGVDRFRLGLKSAAEYRSLGSRSTTFVEIREGEFAGASGYYERSGDGQDLALRLFKQIGFSDHVDGPFHYFRIGALPAREEVVRLIGGGPEIFVRFCEVGTDEGWDQLQVAGFSSASVAQHEKFWPRQGRVAVETVTKISTPERRAVVKVALNYVAAVAGPETALSPTFDSAREFARHGTSSPQIRVHPFANRWFQDRAGHYISLTNAAEMIVVQLSLLLRTQYFVVLGQNAKCALKESAHFFDSRTGSVNEIPPLPLVPGEPLRKLVT